MPSKIASTPLEILGRRSGGRGFGGGLATVSTLLENLADFTPDEETVKKAIVSTLLENLEKYSSLR